MTKFLDLIPQKKKNDKNPQFFKELESEMMISKKEYERISNFERNTKQNNISFSKSSSQSKPSESPSIINSDFPRFSKDNFKNFKYADFANSNFENEDFFPQKPKTKYTVYYVIIFVLTIILFASIYMLFLQPVNNNQDTSKNQNTAFDSTNTSASQNPSLPIASANNFNTENEKLIDKSKIYFKILNGSGQSGVAANTKEQLQKQGFKVASIGNATKIYNTTTIYYKDKHEQDAQLIKDALAEYEAILENNNEITGEFELIVVIGKR